MRWALPNTGKRSGARVIYIDFCRFGKIYMIDIYAKGDKENITEQEKKTFKKLIENIEKNLREGE